MSKPAIVWRRIKVAAFTISAIAFSSCGPPVKVHPAVGQVFVDGEPAVGAVIVLHPIDPVNKAVYKPSGQVGADGGFVLGTFAKRDGAPIGEYIVAIAWYDANAQTDPQTGERPLKTRAEYADPATSPLRAQIAAGKNEIQAFQLPK